MIFNAKALLAILIAWIVFITISVLVGPDGTVDAAEAHNPNAAAWVAESFYENVTNDKYLKVYRYQANGDARKAMMHAARDACRGDLQEDFSCEGTVR